MSRWVVCLSLLLFSAEAFCASIWTNTTGGFWSAGTNWLGGAPSNTAQVWITNANSKTVTIDSATPATNLNLLRLQLWAPVNVTNTLSLTDASINPLMTSSSLTVGRGGAMVMTNSAVTDAGSLTISNSGSMLLSGSSLTLNGAGQFFNVYGGRFLLESGSVMVADPGTVTRVGRATNGSLVVAGGTMQIAGTLTLGESFNRSSGLLQISGGSVTLGSFVTMAENIGTSGTILMTGGELVATNGTNGLIHVGNIGTGQMLLSNATVRATSLSIAEGSPTSVPTGIVSVANSQLIIGQDFSDPNFTNIVSIGHYGRGQMTVSNGGNVFLPNTSIARHAGSVGTLTVLSNGFVGFSDDLSIGRFSGSTGSVLVAGGRIVDTNSPIWVGRDGTGQLTISNGLVQTPSLFVAMVPTNTARGTLNISGGTVLISSNLVLGDASLSTGQVAMVSGQVIVTNDMNAALLQLASGSFTLSGGEITADNIVVTNSGATFTFRGGIVHTRTTTVSNGSPFVVGNGTNAATLDLLGGTHSFPDGLIISSNATLTGCGTIIGPISNFGTIATNCGSMPTPPSISQQPISQTVTQGATVTFMVEATGDPPLIYQWRFSGLMGDVPGATNAMLSLTNVQPSDAGNYRVKVSNNSGSTTSVVATLRVLIAPTLTQTTVIGTNFNFSFGSINGLIYNIEYKTNLTDTTWINLGTRTGNGNVLTIPDIIEGVPSRFYRVRVE